MAAPSSAVRRPAVGVPRRAATASSDASERASSGKKRPRAAPARDSSACRTKMAHSRNSVVTAAAVEVITVGGEASSAQVLLQKRMACELDAVRRILKKAELISRRGACNGGAPTAGKKEQFLAPKQRPTPIEDGCNAPSAKKRKISPLVELKQKQIPAPRMSPEERNQLAGRLTSLCGKLPVPAHILVFLEKQFGDPDSHGEMEINIDLVEDSVMFELKTLLDKLAKESSDDKVAEESKDDKLAEESKGQVALEQEKKCDLDQITGTSAQQPPEPASGVAQSTAQAESTGGSAPPTAAASEVAEPERVQGFQRVAPNKPSFVRPVIDMPALIYRANLRRQLREMERAVLPDETIHRRDLQRLGISEYGHPDVMRQLGLVLKAEA